MKEESIKEYIIAEFEEQAAKYGRDRILGTFTLGLANYGFLENENELQTITIYLPTFEELCCSGLKEGTGLYDIRKAYNIFNCRDDIILEVLFAKYYYINSRYRKAYNKLFFSNRERISRISEKERLEKAYDRALIAANEDNYFEMLRLAISAKLYVEGAKTEDCFYINDLIYQEYLLNCKHGEQSINKEKVLKNLRSYIIKASSYFDYNANTKLKNALVKMITLSLEKSTPEDAFVDCLTKKEKEAWDHIRSQALKGEYTFSISKMIEETAISRPIWTNLLKKCENKGFASVKVCGVRGTTIKVREI